MRDTPFLLIRIDLRSLQVPCSIRDEKIVHLLASLLLPSNLQIFIGAIVVTLGIYNPSGRVISLVKRSSIRGMGDVPFRAIAQFSLRDISTLF